MDYKKGQRFQLATDHGNEPGASGQQFHPDGLKHPDGSLTIHPLRDGYPLRAGVTGTVEEVVPADVDGAGNHEEEHVVLSFDETLPTPHVRNVSFTQKEMDTLFEEVE